MTSCWPTMTLLSSATIWLRPLVRRSTVWRSNSNDGGEGGGGGAESAGMSALLAVAAGGMGGRLSEDGGALITGGLFPPPGFVSSTALVSIRIKSVSLFNDSTILTIRP